MGIKFFMCCAAALVPLVPLIFNLALFGFNRRSIVEALILRSLAVTSSPALKRGYTRFFYEIYSRRLKLYRKILKQISLFSDKTFSGTIKYPLLFGKITASFIWFYETGILVASPAVSTILKQISDFISDRIIAGKRLDFDSDIESFIFPITKKLKLLRERIRTETYPAIVDKHLFKLTGTKITHRAS